jgi:hypothetical protein
MQIKRFVQFLTDGPAIGVRFSVQNGDGGRDVLRPAAPDVFAGPKPLPAFSDHF